MQSKKGFTLIEVLLALAIIAIALTALLFAVSQSITSTQHLKDKLIRHHISMQGITIAQLNLIPVSTLHEVTQVTRFLGQKWYWRIKIKAADSNGLEQITVTSSKRQEGPFESPLFGFRYHHD